MVKLLRMKMMLLLAAMLMGVGTAWADSNVSTVTTSFSATGDVTGKFTQTGNFTGASWNLNVTWGGTTSWQAMNASKGSQIGSGSNPATAIVLTGSNIPGTITSVKVNSSVASGGTTTVSVSVGNTAFKYNNNTTATLATSAADYDFTGSGSGDVVLTWSQPSTSKAIYIKSITITYTESTDPSISADNVDIDYDEIGGEITFTVNNPVTGGTISASTQDSWITLGNETTSPILFTCAANSETTERTATVTLTYTYNSSETVTKDVTITQAGAPVVYSTIPALFDASTSTAEEVLVTFNNWVVSGVSTNGKNVFVTDNSGNGFVIYDSNGDLDSDYSVGDILSGTAVTCTLTRNAGYAQITNLDASDLTITSGGTATTANIALASLAGVNTGALVSYNGLTCSVSNNKYYLSDGTTTIQLYNSLYAYDALEAGETYNITGIYQQYNDTKEILPRSAADIVKIIPQAQTLTVSATNGSVEITGKTLVNGTCEVAEGASVTATATPAEHYTFTNWTAEGVTLVDYTVNSVNFTMPTNAVTLTANFSQIATHTASFYALGAKASADITVYEGDAITFPSVTAPDGFTFMGWTKTEIAGTQATAPTDLVTSANMGDDDVTYYAVFAIVSSGTETATLTASHTSNNTTYANHTYTDDKGNTWTACNTEPYENKQARYGITNTGSPTRKFTSPTFSGNISKIVMMTYNGSGSDRTFYINSEEGKSGDLGTVAGPNNTKLTEEQTATLGSTPFNQFILQASGALGFSYIKVTYGSQTYSNYCTSPSVSIHVGDSKFTSTYYSKYALVVPENLTAYTFKVNASNKLEISKTIAEGETIAKAQAVILYGNANTDYDLIITATDVTKDANNVLRGFDEASTTTGGTIYYRLTTKGEASTIGFYWGAANGGAFTVGAHKAYVAVDEELSFGAGSRMADIFGFDETTGIDNVNGETTTDNRYFDLQGRHVAQPTKGLYIVNGKKKLVK